MAIMDKNKAKTRKTVFLIKTHIQILYMVTSKII